MKETELRNMLLLLLMLAILLAMTSLAPAQIAPELSAGVAIFAAGPPVSVSASISQRLGMTIGDADFTLDGIFLATPGEGSGAAAAICAKAKTEGNMKAGLGYAPGRNTTKICTTNAFLNLQYVKATPAPAALGFGPTDPPIMELTVGSQTDQQGKPYIGASCTKRFDDFSDLFKF